MIGGIQNALKYVDGLNNKQRGPCLYQYAELSQSNFSESLLIFGKEQRHKQAATARDTEAQMEDWYEKQLSAA